MKNPRVFNLVEPLLVAAIIAMPAVAKSAPILLGPPDPGAEHGFDHWLHGTNGEAWVYVDDTDPANGNQDFVLGNKAAGDENRADWRSRIFSLGPAARGARPITFSFAHKFPGKINGRENMQVYLRFFDAAGTNFLGQRIFRVGFNTRSSNMASYKTLTFAGIHAPGKARTADVWVTANIFVPWTSGTGQFDDFSVTTVSRLGRTLFVVLGGLVIALIIITVAVVRWEHKNRGNISYRHRWK